MNFFLRVPSAANTSIVCVLEFLCYYFESERNDVVIESYWKNDSERRPPCCFRINDDVRRPTSAYTAAGDTHMVRVHTLKQLILPYPIAIMRVIFR